MDAEGTDEVAEEVEETEEDEDEVTNEGIKDGRADEMERFCLGIGSVLINFSRTSKDFNEAVEEEEEEVPEVEEEKEGVEEEEEEVEEGVGFPLVGPVLLNKPHASITELRPCLSSPGYRSF